MSVRNKRARSAKFKIRLDVIAGIVGIIVAIAGLIELLHPFKKLSKASLEIVDFRINNNGPNATLKVKLRNLGGSVAFVKGATLTFHHPKVATDKTDYSAEVTPVYYDWLITTQDVKQLRSDLVLSRRVEANDVDSLEFTIGFEEWKTMLESECSLNIVYNKDQVIQTNASRIVISNPPGGRPTYRAPSDSSVLIGNLGQTQAPDVKVEIIRELAKRQYEAAKAMIRPYLHDPSPEVRAASAGYYGQVLDPNATGEIVQMLKDSSASVREEAYNALLFNGAGGLEQLGQIMNDEDPAIREVAAVILGRIRHAKSEEVLLAHLRDQGVAKTVLGEKVLVSATVIRSLTRIGSTKLRLRLQECLADENRSVRLSAIEACRELQVMELLPVLIEMLAAPDAHVRETVHAALIRLVGEDLGDSPEGWQHRDQDQGARSPRRTPESKQ